MTDKKEQKSTEKAAESPQQKRAFCAACQKCIVATEENPVADCRCPNRTQVQISGEITGKAPRQSFMVTDSGMLHCITKYKNPAVAKIGGYVNLIREPVRLYDYQDNQVGVIAQNPDANLIVHVQYRLDEWEAQASIPVPIGVINPDAQYRVEIHGAKPGDRVIAPEYLADHITRMGYHVYWPDTSVASLVQDPKTKAVLGVRRLMRYESRGTDAFVPRSRESADSAPSAKQPVKVV